MDHHGHDMHAGHDMHSGHDLHQHNPEMVMTTDSPGGSMHMMMMSMFFHFGTKETVLFEKWSFTTTGGLIGSMVGIFFLAALYEGLKYYREYLFWKTYNALQYRAVTIPEKNVVSEDNQIVHTLHATAFDLSTSRISASVASAKPTMWSLMHAFQTALHMIQMVISYFLMLIFMTYNVWLCLAVVIGAGFGYFLFGWKKSVIVDVTEHCH